MGAPNPNPNSAHPRTPPKTIMVVDDEEIQRVFLTRLLEAEGYQLLLASDGEAALSASEAFAGTIHLLITDVMMPIMNGKELADRLCVLRPEIKVLFISGYRRADFWPMDTCEDDTDWLPKPFTPLAFQAKVRGLLHPVPP